MHDQQIHAHEHTREHAHDHEHQPRKSAGKILSLRPSTGIAGDMLATGLAGLLHAEREFLDEYVSRIGLAELGPGCFSLESRTVNEVQGLAAKVALPHEHAHRSFKDIRALIRQSSLEPLARELAEQAFACLAEAEGAVHGKSAEEVTFHEVGALDSILDICLSAALFARLNPETFVCGPLPLCDGVIACAHGLLPSPAPAVLRLLQGVPVRGLASTGETVTPTGLALLKAFGARFGDWPEMVIESQVLVYGSKVFPGVPNGAIFASSR